MKTRYLFLLAGSLVLLAGCKKNSYTRVPAADLVTPRLTVNEGLMPFTGALEVFPCEPGSAVYYGNYANGKLSPVNATYTISNGDIYNPLRPITLPVGDYNLIYWGYSKVQEPIYSDGGLLPPQLMLNADLAHQDYSLRKYPHVADTTYYPVYDLVFANQQVDIGAQDIAVTLKRAVAGLTVILKKTDGTKLNSQIASINVLVGSIAGELNFDTGQPQDQTKTVRFPITIAADSLTATNPTVLVFPSAPNPKLTIVLTLKDGSERTFRTQLDNTLSANTKLTATVNMGDIFSSETDAGGFQVDKWEEKSETVTAEQAQ